MHAGHSGHRIHPRVPGRPGSLWHLAACAAGRRAAVNELLRSRLRRRLRRAQALRREEHRRRAGRQPARRGSIIRSATEAAATAGCSPRAAHSARNSLRSSLRSSLTSQAASRPVGSAPAPPSSMTWRRRYRTSSPIQPPLPTSVIAAAISNPAAGSSPGHAQHADRPMPEVSRGRDLLRRGGHPQRPAFVAAGLATEEEAGRHLDDIASGGPVSPASCSSPPGPHTRLTDGGLEQNVTLVRGCLP